MFHEFCFYQCTRVIAIIKGYSDQYSRRENQAVFADAENMKLLT